MSALLVDLGAAPVATTAGVLAQEPPPPPGKGAEFGKASPVALVVIILLGLATVLLIRSMTRRIKRLPADFDRGADGRGARPAGDEAVERETGRDGEEQQEKPDEGGSAGGTGSGTGPRRSP